MACEFFTKADYPNDLLGTAQRMIHIVEIFTQNAALGVTAGLLLRPKARPSTGSAAMNAVRQPRAGRTVSSA